MWATTTPRASPSSSRTKFTALGGEVVGFEGHATGTSDFKAQLTKVLAAKPDVLYVSDYYSDVAIIAKQARELGFKGPMVGGDGWDSPKLVEIAGPAVEGCFFTNHYAKEDKSPIVQEFVKKYTDKYKASPDALAALAYDATNIMLDAINRAGSTDGTAIQGALVKTDLKVVTGQVKFDCRPQPREVRGHHRDQGRAAGLQDHRCPVGYSSRVP